jgi:hypothetical protein
MSVAASLLGFFESLKRDERFWGLLTVHSLTSGCYTLTVSESVTHLARELKSIDIGVNPKLMRIVEEVRSSNEPRVLRRDREDLVIVVPAKRARRPSRAKTLADYAAFRAAADSWKDVDTD